MNINQVFDLKFISFHSTNAGQQVSLVLLTEIFSVHL